jgi:hypothetical protein
MRKPEAVWPATCGAFGGLRRRKCLAAAHSENEWCGGSFRVDPEMRKVSGATTTHHISGLCQAAQISSKFFFIAIGLIILGRKDIVLILIEMALNLFRDHFELVDADGKFGGLAILVLDLENIAFGCACERKTVQYSGH